MPGITTDVDWKILPPESVPGNNANRFDTNRQSDTLGPDNPMADSAPDETDGAAAGQKSPSAG